MINIYMAIILASMTLLGALGGYFFKKASSPNIQMLPALMIGGLFYVSGALLNILLLRELPYSLVFPLTSITYLWTLIIAYFYLGEKLTPRKIFGVLFILAGTILLVQ